MTRPANTCWSCGTSLGAVRADICPHCTRANWPPEASGPSNLPVSGLRDTRVHALLPGYCERDRMASRRAYRRRKHLAAQEPE